MSSAAETVGHDRSAPSVRAPATSRRSAAKDGHAGQPTARTGKRFDCALADVLQILASVLWVPQAALIAVAIGKMGQAQSVERTLWLALGVLLIGVLKAGLDAIGSRKAFLSARTALSKARKEAIDALSRRAPLDVDRAASGRAGSVVAEQAEMIVPYRARYRTAQMRVLVVPPLILLCILPFSWAAAAVLLIAAPLIPLFMMLIGWRAKEASEKQLIETGGMNAFLLDRLRGLATIRALDAVDATAKRLRADAESLRQRTMGVLKIAFLSSAVLELFAALGVAMVAVYIGFHLLGQLPFGAWGGKLTLAEGLFILLLAPAFFEPLRELSAVWHDRAAGTAAEAELERLAADGPTIVGACEAGPQPAIEDVAAPGVRFNNVTFSHTGTHSAVFERLNFAIAPGEHVALLGPSGSGKSSLLALIAGLAAPSAGSIAIGRTPLSQHTADRLRARMAWIGQRPHIFAGTLASNVALGRANVGAAGIASALSFAHLDEVAKARGPALIGENGQGLSGGEALRLALARIAVNPEAHLILADEATAHLDEATAREIIGGLKKLAGGRTMIVATHDPVLAASMDRIIRVLDLALGEAA